LLDESLGQAAASWRAAGRLFDRIALSDGPDVVGHCRQLRVPSPRELLEHAVWWFLGWLWLALASIQFGQLVPLDFAFFLNLSNGEFFLGAMDSSYKKCIF
jgi:hypothetical protein